MRGADLLRRPQALVGLRRWHADVRDHDVGRVAAHLEQQVVGGRRLADDLETGVGEQPRDPLAQEHGVLGEHDPERAAGRAAACRARRAAPSPSRERPESLPRSPAATSW